MEDSNYDVVVRLSKPDFAAERRYVRAEGAYVKRKEQSAHRSRVFGWFGGLRRDDWRHYADELKHYERQLAKHEEEIEAGLMPVKIDILREHGALDGFVRIRMHVESGEIHEKKKAPVRPVRIDGAPNYLPDRPHWHMPGGFRRSGIRIGRTNVDVTFSGLEANDSALLVNRVLYIQTNPQTRLKVRIAAGNARGWEREVGLPVANSRG